jgi:uncharacterized membrane protein required for colicin V production
MKTGIIVELFKLLGTLLAIFLAYHNYARLADFLLDRFAIKVVPIEFLDFMSFAVLLILGYLVCLLLRIAFFHIVKVETVSLINRWGGLVLSIGRGILFVSIIIYLLAISTITYFKDSVDASYFGKATMKIAPAVYGALWNGAVSKFMPQGEFNKNIEEIINSLKS